jgi:protein kinase A
MPTLGFLKKKRTKESSASKDSPSDSQPTSPITPTTSQTFDNSIASVSTQSTVPQAQSASTDPVKEESPAVAGEQQPMTQGVSHIQQSYAASPHAAGTPVPEQQNLPSINNLIHPPQHDGAAQSYPAQMASNTSTPANGGAGHSDHSSMKQPQPQTPIRQTKGKYSLTDFEILRTLGTGSFGRVHLVQSKHNQRFYAVKVLKKQQVVKMKQVEHTNDERRMLQEVKHPFLITLWGTFQDSKNLYMVMDFVEGGELFSLLRKSQVCDSNLDLSTLLIDDPAFPQSRCQVLRCRSRSGSRIPPLETYHLPRSEA